MTELYNNALMMAIAIKAVSKYFPGEIEITAFVSNEWNARIEPYMYDLETYGFNIDTGDVNSTMIEILTNQYRNSLTVDFADAIDEKVAELLSLSADAGYALSYVSKAVEPRLLEMVGDLATHVGWIQSMNFRAYAASYLERFTLPAIQEAIAELQASTGLTKADKQRIKRRLKGISEGSNYWSSLANIYTNRAYNLGVIARLDDIMVEKYKLWNPMDERTGDICRMLNGRIFTVSRAIELSQQLLSSEPGSDQHIAPWPTGELRNRLFAGEVEIEELSQKGILIPPFHPKCRTVINPI